MSSPLPSPLPPLPPPSPLLASGVSGLSILLTGGTSGLGLAFLRALLAGGARVAFCGRRVDLGAALASELGAAAAFIPADVRLAADCAQLVARAREALGGRIDVLINCAGALGAGSVLEVSEDDWDETIAVNLTAAWRLTRLVLPDMRARRSGNIVNVCSDWGIVGAAGFAAFSVSKAALIQLTRVTALEHAREGIRVNALCPGETTVEREHAAGAPLLPHALADAPSASAPIGRTCRASEVAAALLFLASRGVDSMTGACLVIDGGATAM